MGDVVADVERAMIAIRRSQTRRVLGREAEVDLNSVAVLDVIEACASDGTDCTVAAVTSALSVDQPRASRLVAKAVADGFVRRSADQLDGRRTLLSMTAAGRSVVAQVHSTRQRRFAAAMEGWSAAERETFASLLTRFVAAF